jgi:isoquinoline 1-oxidoreductase beta subunit
VTTRRQFLIGSAAVVGGFVIRCRPEPPDRLPAAIEVGAGQTVLTPYVLIDQDGITIFAPRAEMGQGIHTTLAALVAEELDVAFEDIRVEHGPASELYSNTIMYGPPPVPGEIHSYPTQATGAQTSIRDAYVKMRKAGAAARIMLVHAAAARLGVDPETLATRDGSVVDPSGQRISYLDLAAAAADIEPPQDPPLKPREEWRLLGQSLPRVDMPGKCTGTAEYGIDVALPDLLYATVRRNPRLVGKMLGFEASGAANMPGVEQIIPMETGVIVVATNTWYAFEAAKKIDIDWGPARYPETTAGHRRSIEVEFFKEHYYRPRDDGDVEAALNDRPIIEGAYRAPYLAHAAMEPMNATALLRDGRLDIWAGNQFPTLAVLVGAQISGLRKDAVRVHTPYMGGGFGRRFEMDDVEAAVRAAMAIPGRPVRVTYTREEDFTHDIYRPMASARFRASVADGRPTALDLDIAAPSLFVSGSLRRNMLTGERDTGVPTADVSVTAGARKQPYEIENYRITAYRSVNLLPVGWWRAVGASQNSFFHESIMDELAYEAAADPLEMRLSLLTHRPSRQVLEGVAEMSSWGSELPEGHARGVAYVLFKRLATATVIEIIHSEAGIKLHKAFSAVDVGIALDPRNIEAQVQGALNFAMSASIFGEITVTDQVVDQTNFDDYPLLQMRHAPPIEVRIFESGDEIRGVGEAATPTAAPALGNAIFAATGTRIRELPFGKHFRFV